jgi:arginine/lysine/ornithine decarboxylase
LPEDIHPITLGAAMCSDSAHKTLPVLTGGAYLHISPDYPEYAERARDALSLFASTSPSYLTLASLDICNRRLSEDYPQRIIALAK